MQEIIYSHGWPKEFKRTECKQALVEWEGQFRKTLLAELQAKDGGLI